MNATAAPDLSTDVDLPQLERSLRQPRLVFSYFMSLLTGIATIAAMFPLFSVLYMLVKRGGANLRLRTLTELPPAAMMPGGGIGNAIAGTIMIVLIATLLSVPIGILTAVYIAEFGPDTTIASFVRFAAKVLTGLRSILAGVFAFAAVVMFTGGFSAPAGGVALALLMLPTIILTAEDAITRVPNRMREAAVGMGATPSQVVTRILLPTALPGILTGIMLAIARAAGETAPLLFTSLFSEFWMSPTPPAFVPKALADLMKPTASLAVLIYNYSGSPFENQIELAWTARWCWSSWRWLRIWQARPWRRNTIDKIS
jgi:phosphate transport system permease protein